MSNCVKTGATVHVEPYGTVFRGDVFEIDEVRYFRLTSASETRKLPEVGVDFRVEDWEEWFDGPVSTMICRIETTEKLK